jgi:DNA-binding XRE family transcriptional regulator
MYTSETQARSRLGAILRTLRLEIAPDAVALGERTRLQARCGRPVTQEELAEIVGVSRNWYRRVENGEARASFRLLDRLADALTITENERMKLLDAGMPELRLDRYLGGHVRAEYGVTV